MPRLEKVDRDRVRDELKTGGCRYVRVNHGGAFSGKTGRPDLEGLGLDRGFFGVEMKAEDKNLWDATTPAQRLELKTITAAGGKGCVCKLEKAGARDWNACFLFVRPDGTPGPLMNLPIETFVKAILGTRKGPE